MIPDEAELGVPRAIPASPQRDLNVFLKKLWDLGSVMVFGNSFGPEFPPGCPTPTPGISWRVSLPGWCPHPSQRFPKSQKWGNSPPASPVCPNSPFPKGTRAPAGFPGYEAGNIQNIGAGAGHGPGSRLEFWIGGGKGAALGTGSWMRVRDNSHRSGGWNRVPKGRSRGFGVVCAPGCAGMAAEG